METIINFLNHIERTVRRNIRRYPVIHTFIGGISGIIFLRGVWKIIDAVFIQFPDMLAWVEGGINIGIAIILVMVFALILSFIVAEKVEYEIEEGQKMNVNKLASKVDLLEAHIGYLDQKLAQKSETLHNG